MIHYYKNILFLVAAETPQNNLSIIPFIMKFSFKDIVIEKTNIFLKSSEHNFRNKTIHSLQTFHL